MKPLKELCISPAPWRRDFIDETVRDADDKSLILRIAAFGNEDDIRLIACAPALYEALYNIVNEQCRLCLQEKDGKCISTGKCRYKEIRELLERAGGM